MFVQIWNMSKEKRKLRFEGDKNEVIPMRQRMTITGMLKKQGSLRGTMFITSEVNTLRIVITFEINTDIHVK